MIKLNKIIELFILKYFSYKKYNIKYILYK